MSSSMLSGVSGLQASQEMLNVVGNNLANMNTAGFKAQTPMFSDLLYQTLAPASLSANSGGTNPIQVGFGVMNSTMEANLNQGALTTTGNPLDLALQGQGYFVANSGSGNLYTRAGSFSIDANGYLVDPATGYRIQRMGTVGEATATTPGFQTPGIEDIQIPLGTGVPGHATTTVILQGNLSAQAPGPMAQVLTTASPFTSGGAAATSSTTLNSLSDNVAPYQAGDSLDIQGTTSAGATVNATLGVGPTTTLGDLLTALNTDFPGSTASIDSNGNLVMTSNTTGPSKLQVTISDAAGDKGASSWTAHGFQVTTAGANGTTVSTAIQINDTQGTPHNLSLTFQKQGNNLWNLTASIPSSDGTMINSTVTGITFNDDGSFRQLNGAGTISFLIKGLSSPQSIAFNFGTPNGFNGLTQFGGASSAAAINQDGYEAGTLSSVSVGKDGTIDGVFTNGQIFPLAQLAIANFINPEGLDRVGTNYFNVSANSGVPQIGAGQSGGRGSIQEGALESSNVDVSLEFTQLITAQQSYQVNAKSITISSEVLQDLANIIR